MSDNLEFFCGKTSWMKFYPNNGTVGICGAHIECVLAMIYNNVLIHDDEIQKKKKKCNKHWIFNFSSMIYEIITFHKNTCQCVCIQPPMLKQPSTKLFYLNSRIF